MSSTSFSVPSNSNGAAARSSNLRGSKDLDSSRLGQSNASAKSAEVEENKAAIDSIREFLSEAGVVPLRRVIKIAEAFVLDNWLSMKRIAVLYRKDELRQKLETIQLVDEEEVDMIMEHFKRTPTCTVPELQRQLNETELRTSEEISSLRATIVELQKLLAECQSDNDDETDRLTRAVEECKRANETELSKAKEDIIVLNKTVAEFKKTIVDNEFEESQLNAELIHLRTENAQLHCGLTAVNETVQDLQLLLAEQQEMLQQKQLEAEQAIMEIQSQSDVSLHEFELENVKLRNTISEILNQFADHKSKSAAEVETCRSLVSEVNKQMEQTRAKSLSAAEASMNSLMGLEETLQQVVIEKDAISARLTEAELKVDELTRLCRSKDEENATARSSIQDLQSIMVNNQSEAKEESSRLLSQIAELNVLVNRCREDASVEAAAFRTTVVSLQKQLADAHARTDHGSCVDRDEKDAVITQEQSAFMGRERSNSLPAEELQQQMNLLQAQNGALNDAAEVANRIIGDLQARLHSAAESSEHASQHEISLRQAIADLSQQIELLRNEKISEHSNSATAEHSDRSQNRVASVPPMLVTSPLIVSTHRSKFNTPSPNRRVSNRRSPTKQVFGTARNMLLPPPPPLTAITPISPKSSSGKSPTAASSETKQRLLSRIQSSRALVKSDTSPPSATTTASSSPSSPPGSSAFSVIIPMHDMERLFHRAQAKEVEAQTRLIALADDGNHLAKSFCIFLSYYSESSSEWVTDSLKSQRYFSEVKDWLYTSINPTAVIEGGDVDGAMRAMTAYAQLNLGKCHALRVGVPKPDDTEAAQLFLQAARAGLPTAQYNAGVCCEQGIGVTADMKEALKWYELASANGDKDAQFVMGRYCTTCCSQFNGLILSWFQVVSIRTVLIQKETRNWP
jgi:myosin heavy subunit